MLNISLFFKKLNLLLINLLIFSSLPAQIQFDFQSEFNYLKGNAANSLSDDWVISGFDDSGWEKANAPFRYGDGSGGTELLDMLNNYTTLYLRSSFEASNIGSISEIEFNIDYDDGFVLWINGNEVLKQNAPLTYTYSAVAPTYHESGTSELFVVDSSRFELIEGVNTLAIQGFNYLPSSTDFYFDANINAQLSLPVISDSIPVLFDAESGFYTEPFDLTLSSPDSAFQIIYTIDGRDPQSSVSAITGSSPLVIKIDPDSTTGRAATPAFIVRASLVKEGFSPSNSNSKTFIFMEELKTQSFPGGDWPSSSVNGQVIDLDMDPDIISDIRYADQFDEAFMQIPTISVATNLDNLFSPISGIYVNATKHGINWERDCSVELINPDGQTGFQQNAGIRIRGGYSRNSSNPKHAFRLFFRSEYGDSKLRYPLFGTEGTDEFDKIDLRTAQNYSWSIDGSEHNTFLRDIFSRDSQLAMGNPGTRGRYYHLFLNGMYWGLYQSEERAEARYAESYFGDSKEDYDVIKVVVDTWPYYNEATDGTMKPWEELWSLCLHGFSENEDYFSLEGKDARGNPMKDSRVLVDIDNLIDYMLVIFYTGNVDAPVSAWHSNNMPNNYYAVYNRKDKGKGFVFFAHDSEHSMFINPINVHDGINENRVTINDPPMQASSVLSFQPQWLHHKLMENPEYRIRFADRAYKQLSHGGILTEDQSAERFSKRAAEINYAIVAESARWGDTKIESPRNKIDDWVPEITHMLNSFFPYRTNIVIGQLSAAGIYTFLDPPIITESGIEITNDIVYFDGSLDIRIDNINGFGTMYYTTDGSDPRSVGGSISSVAQSASSDISMNLTGSGVFHVRVKSNSQWSAIKKVSFLRQTEDYSNLKVTELHYHPRDILVNADTSNGKNYEFIEFKNIGANAINLSGLVLDSAINYQMPEATILPPGQFYVVASKPESFYALYGMSPSGNFSKNFSNSGEQILLSDSEGNEIISFVYSDKLPWPTEPDGDGYSMVSKEISPIGNPDEASYWRTSIHDGGSPFSDDIAILMNQPLVNSEPEGVLSLYPNPTLDNIIVFLDENGTDDIVSVKLSAINGRTVYENKIVNGSKISLRDLHVEPGIYLIQVVGKRRMHTEKIVFLAR